MQGVPRCSIACVNHSSSPCPSRRFWFCRASRTPRSPRRPTWLRKLDIKGDEVDDVIKLDIDANGNYRLNDSVIVPPLAASAEITITIDGGDGRDDIRVFDFERGYRAVTIHGGPGDDSIFAGEAGVRQQVFGDDGDDSISTFQGELDAFGGNGDDLSGVPGRHHGIHNGFGRCRNRHRRVHPPSRLGPDHDTARSCRRACGRSPRPSRRRLRYRCLDRREGGRRGRRG